MNFWGRSVSRLGRTATAYTQQLFRSWGWEPNPPPPGVFCPEYEEDSSFWARKYISRLGRITKFEDGRYFIAERPATHFGITGLD